MENKKIVNTKGLFFGCNKTIEFLEEGNTYREVGTEDVRDTKELFENIRKDTRKKGINSNELYTLKNCIYNNILLSKNCAINNPHIRVIGSHNVNTNDITITFNDNIVHLPTICLQKQIGLVGKEFKKVLLGLKIDLKDTDFYYPEVIIKENKPYIQSIQKDRLERFNNDFWNKELREKYAVETKINKWMMANTTIAEQDLCSIMKFVDGIELPVEILSGTKLYDGYVKSKCVMKSTISSSCMMGKNKSFFKIYKDNAEMVVLRDEEGLISCRAILWTAKSPTGKKVKVLDRVYYTEDQQLDLMNNWADKHNIYHLEHNSYNNENIVLKDKKVNLAGYYVELKEDKYTKYPYLDTFYKMIGKRLYRFFSTRELKHTDGTAIINY